MPPFAEIDIAPTGDKNLSQKREAFFTGKEQTIPQRTHDPLRTRFRDMRRIADYAPYAYQNDNWLFYEQAKFMEDVTDDYGHRVAFSAFYPFYNRMGYEQLRTYFTWRTQVRAGDFAFIGASYLYLYIYELLSCIGCENAQDALRRLRELYTHYNGDVPALAQYFEQWLRDFYVYYDVAEECGTPAPKSAAQWFVHSAYRAEKSKFFTAGNGGLMSECTVWVFAALGEICAARATTLDELIFFDGTPRAEFWRPFAQALFYPWQNQPDRRVSVDGQTFVCRGNRWSVERKQPCKGTRELVGYILRKIEACLRVLTGYKQKLTADPAALKHTHKKLSAAGLTIAQFNDEIEKAVTSFWREKNRVEVKVNTTAVEKIREQAQETTEKLTVEDNTHAPAVAATPPVPAPVTALTPSAVPAPTTGMDAFLTALTPPEREVIALLSSSAAVTSQALRAIADAHATMPEVIIESINEKAFDAVGDQILDTDGEITLYEEYRHALSQAI